MNKHKPLYFSTKLINPYRFIFYFAICLQIVFLAIVFRIVYKNIHAHNSIAVYLKSLNSLTVSNLLFFSAVLIVIILFFVLIFFYHIKKNMPKELKIDGSRVLLKGKNGTEKINIFKADNVSFWSSRAIPFFATDDFYCIGIFKIYIDSKNIRLFFRIRSPDVETNIKAYLAEKTRKY